MKPYSILNDQLSPLTSHATAWELFLKQTLGRAEILLGFFLFHNTEYSRNMSSRVAISVIQSFLHQTVNLCVYTAYVCTHPCLCTYVCMLPLACYVYTYVCAHMYTCLHVYAYICLCIYIPAHVCSMYVGTSVYLAICGYTCICVYAHACMHV